ncbi:MAG: hypothetical protein H0X64_05595 [Gemmatimonadaceae bacterium]|nr:hypothetical protein [Gemmatimonadaceae bacterium]
MAAALLLALPVVAPAQRPVIDEGTLVVSKNGARAGRESFRIQAAENGRFLTATGQSVLGETRITPALSVDSASGTPMLYRVEARSGGTSERLQAAGRPGRLSAAFQRAGGESAKEYVLSGNVVVLDDDVYHQYALLALLGWSGRVTVIVPRQASQQAATLTDRGASSVRVDGRDVPARHFILETAGGSHEFWVDGQRRLLRVSIPGRGVEAVREELPR